MPEPLESVNEAAENRRGLGEPAYNWDARNRRGLGEPAYNWDARFWTVGGLSEPAAKLIRSINNDNSRA